MQVSPPRPITPPDAHYTFGYYDRCPWSPDLAKHLALRIPHQHGLPRKDEKAVVCSVDLASGRIDDLAETLAWNHQQGSMTHWLPGEDGCVIYNDRDGDLVFSRVVDAGGDPVRELPRPVYCLTRDGRFAASLDFSRIKRKGYSYAVTDAQDAKKPRLPDDDGLWIMDTTSGESRLILSYARVAEIHPDPDDFVETFCWMNHAIFNGDDSRVMVLFRYYPAHRGDGGHGWKTYLYTVNLDGSDPRCSLPHPYWAFGKVTHQMWGRTPTEILLDAEYRCRGGGEFTVYDDGDMPPRFRVVGEGSHAHGHQRFSPDGRWLVTDSYPVKGIQHLKVVGVESGAEVPLARMDHWDRTPENGDWRCDLHPRWRPDGKAISIDSVDDGMRRIYVFELDC